MGNWNQLNTNTKMKPIAIKAEHISKQYRLGQVGTGTLSHDLNRFWHRVRGKEDPYLRIGEVNVTLRNVDAIKGITDPILRYFIEHNFPFYTHLSDVQEEIKELTKY